MKIALKEVEETKYWLVLCEKAKSYPYEKDLTGKAEELSLIMGKIFSTSKKNLKKETR